MKMDLLGKINLIVEKMIFCLLNSWFCVLNACMSSDIMWFYIFQIFFCESSSKH
ncbi:unnamed protein product [Brassica rapa]|uniref:Uncharacterized protein n=1 Tax=Brassica campestris TaxID=3711 RepID=A0A3P6AHS1_BRACM|nr:unnamed protein product [Brassica rapa]VDC89185.1 unnamed protein product [Brassica rapa]